jgi:2-desacetyl-2-hydroxyethyl bacteriochlorophyllide A dehydrogenase
MKAAIFYGGKDIRIEERPIPEPGPGEVLIKVISCGVCGSDLHYYRGDTPFGKRPPHERGHELSGEVVQLGPGVKDLKPGQPVGIEAEHLLGCGICRPCRRGEYHLCLRRGYRNGQYQESHGFSQYDTCVMENCHPLPDPISYDHATLIDCYACGVHALNRVPHTPLDTIVIFGTGAIGMTLGQVAKAYGIERVILIGTRRGPLDLAKRAGAADEGIANCEADPVEAVGYLTKGEGADAIFETVGGSGPTLNQAIAMARFGGTISILGIFTQPQPVDLIKAYRKELRLQWSNSYSRWQGISEYRMALRLMEQGRVNPAPLITHHYPLDQIVQAFEAAENKRASGAIKVLVHPNA